MKIALTLLLAGVLAFVTGGCANRSVVTEGAGKANPEPSLGLRHDASQVANEATKNQSKTESSIDFVVDRQSWQFAEYPGQLISTPNYRLYTTLEYERILERLPVFYERALDHYTTTLANLPKPDMPLETFLFQNRRQWQLKTQEMLPEQADMFSNLGRGGFTTKGTSVLYYIDGYGRSRDTLAIAAHEGWHQYTQQTFKHQLPIWLEEGVATYMEGHRNSDEGLVFLPAWNFERLQTLRDAVRSQKLISLDSLLGGAPQTFLSQSKDSLLTYYAQVWALTRFLAESEDGRYRTALETVLTDAAEGRLVGRMMSSTVRASLRRNGVGTAVAQEYFNRDLQELEREYLAFVDHILANEGRRW